MSDGPPISDIVTALDNYYAGMPRVECKSSVGMDASVQFSDGRRLDFGDAIYHPENAAMAHFFCVVVSAWPRLSAAFAAGASQPARPASEGAWKRYYMRVVSEPPIAPYVASHEAVDGGWCLHADVLAALSASPVPSDPTRAVIDAARAECKRMREAAFTVMDEMVQVGASGDEDECGDGVGLSHKMLMDWYLTLKRAVTLSPSAPDGPAPTRPGDDALTGR